ncbi:MAG: sigma-54 dependent transcriptional regulator [Candidatus Binatia bacterium]|nr:sigma-54 dependent transcriptional regulator [Candidatus Binatia bacterium]
MSLRVLVADDEDTVLFALREYLGSRGWQVTEARSAAELWRAIEQGLPDVVLLDYQLPDATALDILAALRERIPTVPVIILTGFGSIELAVKAMQLGAKQFLTKPLDLPTLATLIERVDSERRAEALYLVSRESQVRREANPFVGTSQAIRRVEQLAKKIARSDAAVLLTGETGTGKGVLARWLHAQGPRRGNPFVDINCAGLGGELLHAELFGYEKGAFTGAVERKLGLVELAHRGTLFLDEIGDMDLAVQAKLLKVLEERRFRRLGAVADVQVDIRLISATHHDLTQAVVRGSFRSDLYYRIAVVTLELPPLRERKEDVPLLAEEMLRQFAPAGRDGPWRLSPEAIQALVRYSWPGNIRELRNVLERATLLANGPTIGAEHLAVGVAGFVAAPNVMAVEENADLPLAEVEKRHILRVFDAVGGDVARAAERLGVPRSTLYQRLQSYGVQPRRPRKARRS